MADGGEQLGSHFDTPDEKQGSNNRFLHESTRFEFLGLEPPKFDDTAYVDGDIAEEKTTESIPNATTEREVLIPDAKFPTIRSELSTQSSDILKPEPPTLVVENSDLP